jgi:hypothetical protein
MKTEEVPGGVKTFVITTPPGASSAFANMFIKFAR